MSFPAHFARASSALWHCRTRNDCSNLLIYTDLIYMEPLRVCSCHGSLFAYSMLIGITQQQLEDSSLIVEIQSMNLQGGKEVIQEAQDTAVLSYVGFIFS